MRRLARRSAGSQVLARAQRLSDDLLALEETTLGRVDATFRAGANKARPLIRAAWKRADGKPLAMSGDQTLVRALRDLHADVVRQCDDRVQRLAEDSRRLSLASIEDELRLCERTLSRAYAGLATAAVAAAKESVDQVVVDRLAAYASATDTATARFVTDSREQMRLASLRPDPLDTVIARVLSETPVSKPGCSGRGMWWRATSDVLAETRDVSIRLASQVRTQAMVSFNDLGEERG